MSKPSYSTIELWLFELAEGNLSAEQVEQLRVFLLQHPELEVEADVWKMARVDSKTPKLTDKQLAGLKREKPVSLYAAIGATTFILLSFFGCYQLIDGNQARTEQKLISTNSMSTSHDRSGDSDSKEISDLKETIEFLREENEKLTATVFELNKQRTQIASASNSQREIDLSDNLNTTDLAITVNKNRSHSSNEDVADYQESENTRLEALQSNSDSENHFDRLSLGEIEALAPKLLSPIATDMQELAQNKFFDTEALSPSASLSSGYKNSIKSRLTKFGRTIQRMMDNPVALKNSRDPNYHVPGMLPQDVNFSATGTLLSTRVQTLSRANWLGAENESFVNQVAIDGYSYGIRGGLGIQMNHTMYKRGGIHVGDVALTYSPKLSITRQISFEPSFRFKMGSKLLYHQNMSDVSAVEFERGNVYDYYADGSQPIGQQMWYKDIGAGLMINTKWFFVGVNGDNLLHHKDNIYSTDIENPRRSGTRFMATAGTDWENVKKTMRLSPYLVYHKHESLSEFWVGMNYSWEWFNVGASISSKIDPAASIGIRLKNFSLNYNADYSNSILTGNRTLSHQVSLRFLTNPSRFGRRLLNL